MLSAEPLFWTTVPWIPHSHPTPHPCPETWKERQSLSPQLEHLMVSKVSFQACSAGDRQPRPDRPRGAAAQGKPEGRDRPSPTMVLFWSWEDSLWLVSGQPPTSSGVNF